MPLSSLPSDCTVLVLGVGLPTATVPAGRGNCDKGLSFVFPGRHMELSDSVVSIAVRHVNIICSVK